MVDVTTVVRVQREPDVVAPVFLRIEDVDLELLVRDDEGVVAVILGHGGGILAQFPG
jgi:hypothetical protein